MKIKLPMRLVAPLAASAAAFSSYGQDEASSGDEDVFELSPFVVESDEGYRANSTLAGSRLNTQLKDTAAAIDVLTQELIRDIGATNVDEAIRYSTNSDEDIGIGDVNDNAQFEFGAGGVNIRGLSASRTRDFFPIYHRADGYNVTRIEEQRGPNSVLFGLGSAAGIVNVGTKRAVYGNTFTNVGLMYTSEGGYRGTLDYNYGGGDDSRFAVRFNTTYKDFPGILQWNTEQKAKASHLTLSAKLTDRISFRVEGESSREDSQIAKSSFWRDGVSDWLYDGGAFTSDNAAATDPTQTYTSGTSTYPPYVVNNGSVPKQNGLRVSKGTGNTFWEENFPELWDRSINDAGAGQTRSIDVDVVTAAIEWKITDRTFLELSAHGNSTSVENYLLTNDSGLRGDPNNLFADGSVNPNAGKLYMEAQWARFQKDYSYQSYRATLSHELDLERFGTYRFALLLEDVVDDLESHHDREVWVDENGNWAFRNRRARDSQNIAYRRTYIENPGDWESYQIPGPQQTGLVPPTAYDGRMLNTVWGGQSAAGSRQDLQSKMLGIQARYFDGDLVLGLGFREDELGLRLYDTVDDAVVDFKNWSDSAYTGQTKTLGAVYHLNENFRLMYNQSENFGLPHPSRREYPDFSAGLPTEGNGRDYGVGFSFAENRISGRLTRFETDQKNVYLGGYRITNYVNGWVGALQEAAVIDQAQADLLFIDGTGGIKDQEVFGYEFALTANPTKNWVMNFRYSFTDGVQTNTFSDQAEYIAGDPSGRLGGYGGITFFEQYGDVIYSDGGTNTLQGSLDRFKQDIAEERAADGIALAKNRPHKANIFTRYSFKEGPLKGINIGGGVRWLGKSDLGAGLDENGEYLQMQGDSFYNVDGMVSYTFNKLLGLDKVRVQLNVSNLFDNDDYIVSGRSTSTQEVTRVTYLTPRSWRLGADFGF